MSAIVCDRTGEPAKYQYQWAWGETGFCSEAGRAELAQLSTNLSQQVTFAPLVTNEVVPVGRDERATLMGRIQALEYELDENEKLRSQLLADNERLRAENRGLSIAIGQWKRQGEQETAAAVLLRERVAALESQNAQLEAAITDYRDAAGADDIARLTAELEESKQEVARLSALVPPTS